MNLEQRVAPGLMLSCTGRFEVSSSPLYKKMQIKGGNRVAVLHAPEGYGAALGDLPDGVTVS